MQVIEAGEVDVKICQDLINFMKQGKFEVNAISSHRLSNVVKWVAALGRSVATSYDDSRKEKIPEAGKPSGFKVKSIHQGTADGK